MFVQLLGQWTLKPTILIQAGADPEPVMEQLDDHDDHHEADYESDHQDHHDDDYVTPTMTTTTGPPETMA